MTVRDRAKLRTCPEPALWLWASFAEILGNNGEKKAGRFRVLTYLAMGLFENPIGQNLGQ